MITDSELLRLKNIVQEKFSFEDDPFDYMWVDGDGEPLDDFDGFWRDPCVIDVKYGCSKVVLFCSYLDDYVLKIPFIGEFLYVGLHREFSNAVVVDNKDVKWDYCRVEEGIYKSACKEGLGDLFCGTRFLCRINGFPIYVSEMSGDALDEDTILHQSSADGLNYIKSKRKEPSRRFLYAPGDMDDDTIGMFYDSWGKELTDKLLDFIVDNDIRDCHNGNVAFRDGKIRLIDYSSFYK